MGFNRREGKRSSRFGLSHTLKSPLCIFYNVCGDGLCFGVDLGTILHQKSALELITAQSMYFKGIMTTEAVLIHCYHYTQPPISEF